MKICFIAPYPPEKAGLTQYSQKLIDTISKIKNNLIYVICGKNKENKKETENSKIHVRRIWNRNSLFYPFCLFKEINKIEQNLEGTMKST